MCLLLCAGVSVALIGVVHKNFPATMVMMILAGIFMEVRVRSQDTDTTLHNNPCLPSCPQCRNRAMLSVCCYREWWFAACS